MEKYKISINVEGGVLFCGGWNILKSVSVGSTFIREMRVYVVKFAQVLVTYVKHLVMVFINWFNKTFFKQKLQTS